MNTASETEKRLLSDLEMAEQDLGSISRDDDPDGWSTMMNIKGVTLMNLKRFDEAEKVFSESFEIAGNTVKPKIAINYAKNCYFSQKIDEALQLLARAFQMLKATPKLQTNFIMGHAHMLRGQVFFRAKNEKKALAEFRMAEYFLEKDTDLLGVGLACMEIARIHINNKDMPHAWNYLKKSELCFRHFGEEEALGVSVCKAVALLHAAKEEEAQELMKMAYEKTNEFGMARYVIYDVLDAYLDIRTKSPQFAVDIT